MSVRTGKQWVADLRRHGEAGLVPKRGQPRPTQPPGDERWAETALEVMAEHTDQSRPSRTLVIERTGPG
ncbi:helix-turn-helix domain-containing protein [Streptomyces sp. NPDC057271]|uniref:helix-turn-helix domain-containing protein n=1 Tax=unclassified Streptomyces TaxID=2593676 RepID=UPI00364226BD